MGWLYCPYCGLSPFWSVIRPMDPCVWYLLFPLIDSEPSMFPVVHPCMHFHFSHLYPTNLTCFFCLVLTTCFIPSCLFSIGDIYWGIIVLFPPPSASISIIIISGRLLLGAGFSVTLGLDVAQLFWPLCGFGVIFAAFNSLFCFPFGRNLSGFYGFSW